MLWIKLVLLPMTVRMIFLTSFARAFATCLLSSVTMRAQPLQLRCGVLLVMMSEAHDYDANLLLHEQMTSG